MSENNQANRDDCFFCDETERLQTHHIVPDRYDGSDDNINLVQVCPTCHDKLESLYNRRFYRELGVTKDKTIDEQCMHNGCTADAVRLVESRVSPHYVYVCDDHDKCSVRTCGNDPELRPMWGDDEDDVFLLCDSHGGCSRSSCSNKHTWAVDKIMQRTLCEEHTIEWASERGVADD